MRNKDKVLQVYNLLRKNGLKPLQARVLTAQSIYESGWMDSTLARVYNNVFGITYVKQARANGEYVRQSDGHRFASFQSLDKCIEDRIRILQIKTPSYYNFNDVSALVNYFLDNGYIGYNASTEDRQNYTKTVSSIYNTILPITQDEKKNINEGLTETKDLDNMSYLGFVLLITITIIGIAYAVLKRN